MIGRMAVAGALAVAMLSGCAHQLTRPAWQCSATLDAEGVRANSYRLPNRDGTLLSGSDAWTRGFALRPRDFHQVVWERRGAVNHASDGVVTLQLHLASPVQPYRLELRSGTFGGPLLAQGRPGEPATTPQLVTGWSGMNRWLAAGPVHLVATNRAGAVVDSLPIDPAFYAKGLALVRQTSAKVLADAADFRRRCEVHQEITVT